MKAVASYKKRGLEKDVPTYRDRCLEADWEIYRFDDGSLALELPFELQLGEVVVKGYIDRVQWWSDDERATLEDLKTGNLEEWDRRQLGLYSYAAKTIYNLPLRWSRYWFTKTDKPSAWFNMNKYTEEYLTEIYSIVDDIINRRLLLPNPGDHCKLCGVRPWCRENGWLTL